MQAARTGNTEAVELLLQHGARVDARERADDQTALMWAVTQRHPEVVRVLADHRADLHARSKVWRQRVLTCCERFLGDSEGIVTIDRGGFTPLLFAARLGEVASARVLIAAKADVDITAADGSSALALAALSGHPAVATLLLEHGADANASGAGYTALHAAVLRGDLELVNALVRHGANPDVRLANGTPTRRNEKSFAPDWAFDRAWKGGTALWLAARFAEVDMMRALLGAGADIGIAASNSTTPFMVAAQAESVPSRRGIQQAERERRAVEALEVAVAAGADINGTTDEGDTALHLAASKRLNTVVEYLARGGAVLNAKNKKGQTPLAIASMEPEAPKGIAVIYNRPVDDRSTAELLRKLGATE
jgi:ankyrin repeat protein